MCYVNLGCRHKKQSIKQINFFLLRACIHIFNTKHHLNWYLIAFMLCSMCTRERESASSISISDTYTSNNRICIIFFIFFFSGNVMHTPFIWKTNINAVKQLEHNLIAIKSLKCVKICKWDRAMDNRVLYLSNCSRSFLLIR